MNPNRSIPRCFIIKMEEVKERILKTAGEKVNYKGTPISLSADFYIWISLSFFSFEKFSAIISSLKTILLKLL